MISKTKSSASLGLLIFCILLQITCVKPVLAQSEKEISVDDIWLKGKFQPNYLYGLNWMKNSKFYTAQDYDLATRTIDIVKYNTLTGEKADVMVKGNDIADPDSGTPVLIEDYSLSPDESMVLIGNNVEQIYRRSSKGNYYIYDLPSKTIQAVSKDKIMNPAFSPDGSKIAYVKDNNLFYYIIKTGKEVQVTTDGVENKIINGAADWVYEEEFEFTKAFDWSPDSKKIAFYKFDESMVKEYTIKFWNDLYPTNYTYKYPKAGEENAVVSIKVFDLGSSKTTIMDVGKEKDQYIPRLMWTADPNTVSIQRLNRKQNHFEILHADASTGESKVVYEEKNNAYIEIRDDVKYLQDKKYFLLTSEKDGYRHIYLYDVNGKEVEQVTKGKWEVKDLARVDEGNEVIYYSSSEESPLQKHFYSINFNGKGKKQLTDKEGFHEVQVSPDIKYFIDYYSSATKPYVISVHNLPKGKKVKELVNNEALEERVNSYGLKPMEFFQIKTSQDVTLNGFMIKPDDFDPSKKYPVLVTVYGGPGHQTVLNQWGGSNYLWYQLLAQKGYVVVGVDNRGTGGRGAEFKKMTQHQLGKLESEDMIETAKYLSSLSYIDGDRVGIFGWSFGGYLTSLAMTLGADYFKMGIAVAPVTSWRFYDTIYTERFLGLPQENPEGYDKYSPLTHVNKLKGKYLLIHGTADDNVHLQNATMMQQALIRANKQFDAFYYPDKNHGIYGGNTRSHLYTKMTDYILENL